jgi:hypothetical protein
MGFWHTGYMEFHELDWTGEYRFEPSVLKFECAHCQMVFNSVELLRQHRFESHPLRAPLLMLQGRGVGSHPFRITQPLTPRDLIVEGAEHVSINGKAVESLALWERLSRMSLFQYEMSLKEGP